MIERVILDVILCTLATVGLVAIIVVGHFALAGRDVQR
jgi:hypothetical protein